MKSYLEMGKLHTLKRDRLHHTRAIPQFLFHPHSSLKIPKKRKFETKLICGKDYFANRLNKRANEEINKIVPTKQNNTKSKGWNIEIKWDGMKWTLLKFATYNVKKQQQYY